MWKLKSCLIAFDCTIGRHSGKMLGNELVKVINKFDFSDRVRRSFLVL